QVPRELVLPRVRRRARRDRDRSRRLRGPAARIRGLPGSGDRARLLGADVPPGRLALAQGAPVNSRGPSEYAPDPMRARTFLAAAVVLAVLLAREGSARAGDDAVPAVAQADVEASLVEAGKNRPAIEAYLAHYAKAGDEKRAAASRWLVANMSGKGVVPFTLRDGEKAAVPFDPLPFTGFPAAQKGPGAIQ